MTQPQAATALGQPQQFVSKCELGERRVDAVELWEFAALYGKPLEFFFRDLDEKLRLTGRTTARSPGRRKPK